MSDLYLRSPKPNLETQGTLSAFNPHPFSLMKGEVFNITKKGLETLARGWELNRKVPGREAGSSPLRT